MALFSCRECKQQVSSTANTCPHCGAAVKKPASKMPAVIGGLVLIGTIAGLLAGKQDEVSSSAATAAAPVKTAEQLAAEKRAEDERAEDLYRICTVQRAMHDPKSFELVKAVRQPKGELCVEYRGVNGFNAIRTEAALFPPIADRPVPAKSLASCAGLFGQDVTSLRFELYLCK